MNKRTLWLVALMIAVAAIAVAAAQNWPRLNPQEDESVAVVRRGAIDASVSALGRVQPRRQVNLSLQASGPVKAIHAQEGDRVAEGALLLELETPEYEDAVKQAQRSLALREMQLEEALRAPSAAEIALVRARLRQATVARLNAQQEYDEIADEPDAESSDEALALETAKVAYEVAQAEFDRVMEGASDLQIERLQADLDEARLTLRQAQERLAHTRLVAPFAGSVMHVGPNPGENVGAFGVLMVLADLSAFEISAEIDEIDIPSVAEGQSVEITLDAFPGESLQGEIRRIAPGVSETRGATTYEAIIDLRQQELPIRPGMGANLTIITRSVQDALLVPRRAVQQFGRYSVVRVRTGRREEQVVVITGLSNEADIEILSGLREGQIVVLD
ncbi:MAG: efflux RND transporter periplasmic adaptor subunit [Anaerolineae bacterium]|nr:efflux RND transporter periplasmic adaptor subunit [Anaerolineae bacterium]